MADKYGDTSSGSSYAAFLQRTSVEAGCLALGPLIIRIESVDRVASQDAGLVFAHEFVHYLLTALSETGLLLHRLIWRSMSRGEPHPCVSEIMHQWEHLQEVFATNGEMLHAIEIGMAPARVIASFRPDYLAAYNELRDIHTLLHEETGTGLRLLLTLGLLTFCGPLLSTAPTCDLLTADSWRYVLRAPEIDPRVRFRQYYNRVRDLYQEGKSLAEILATLEALLNSDACIVNRRSLERHAARFASYRELASFLAEAAPGYAAELLSVHELIRRVKHVAWRRSSLHFAVRFGGHFGTYEDLLQALEGGRYTRAMFAPNPYGLEWKHGPFRLPYGKGLVMVEQYEQRATSVRVDGNDLRWLHSDPIDQVGAILHNWQVSTLWKHAVLRDGRVTVLGNAFDLCCECFLHGQRHVGQTVVVTEPYLTFDRLETIKRKIREAGREFVAHLVHGDTAGRTAFLAMRRRCNWSFLMVSPVFVEPVLTCLMEKDSPVRLVTAEEFGLDLWLEELLWDFIKHYTKWGW